MKKKYIFKFRLLPVIAYTALVFLLVRARTYHVSFDDMINLPFNSSMELWDVFSLVKASAILGISIWAALTLGYLLITEQIKLKKTKLYIPMLIYTLAVVVSYVMSDYRMMAWTGAPQRFEGVRTILCYMFMLFYTINAVDEMEDVVAIITATVGGVLVACLIGLSQFLWHDFFLTGIGSSIVTGSSGVSVQGQFWPWQIYQTVYNMNYVSVYLCLIVPVLVYALYYFVQKNNYQSLMARGIYGRRRVALIFFTGMMLLLIAVNLYGAESAGGVVGIGVALIIMAIVMVKEKWQKGVLAAVLFAGMVIVIIAAYALGKDTKTQIDYIETGMDRVDMSIDGEELHIIYDRENNVFDLRNRKNHSINAYCFEGEEGRRFQVDKHGLAGKIVIVPYIDDKDRYGFFADMNDAKLDFVFDEDGTKYINSLDEEVSLHKTESFGFEGHLSALSGRGYIWSRTLPLLKKKLLTGYGADTLMLIFPQDDYAGKYSADMLLSNYCDKPHSIYLQMAVGTGIISLIAFLAMMGMGLFMAFRPAQGQMNMQRQMNMQTHILPKVIAAGIVGFLVAGLVNDSSVCVMPMFYGFFGMMAAVCIKTS